ncbi:MAG TPA: YafY family protein [Ilumatobacter sp.]|nr:YafY family protein [Ilumatobacter sp.]
MADTTARTMRLLSLLQRRRYWPGPELAGRLEVSARTLRRDVERLRSLGYAVESDRGVEGGYRLESTAGLAPLLVDNDEAVALAVGLHLAAQGSQELAEASVGALTKVLAQLPAEQRRRADTVRAATAVGPGGLSAGPPLGVLAAVAGACRDRVRLSFGYVAADGAASERYVEPHGLVVLGTRYYLVAFDLDRADWRTFRVDRVDDPRPARTPFPARELPHHDLREYVRIGQRSVRGSCRVVIDVVRPADELREVYGRWVDVADLGGGRSRLTMDVDDFTWPMSIVANADAPFTVIEPPELQAKVAAAAATFAAAAGPPQGG